MRRKMKAAPAELRHGGPGAVESGSRSLQRRAGLCRQLVLGRNVADDSREFAVVIGDRQGHTYRCR